MTQPTSATVDALQQRGELLRRLRQFFYDHQFVEVETPLLAGEVIPEQYIEPYRAVTPGEQQFLQASPELHMKRLVANGMPVIFQITRSFRADEHGPLHNPEFTIVEWYRAGDDMAAGMQLLDDLCVAMLGTTPAKRTSYADAFAEHVGLCPHTASTEALAKRSEELDVPVAKNFRSDNRDEWLNLLLSFVVEPKLGLNEPEILFDYPASQAALAKTAPNAAGIEVAKRYELYYRGVELANGYEELTDAAELRRRLAEVNHARQADGRAELPIPESLLAAMTGGLPDCAGCALGFDRLAMLAFGKTAIAEVIAYSEIGAMPAS